MARKAIIERELKKIKTRDRLRTKHVQMKERLRVLQIEPAENYEEIQELYTEFRNLPRNASPSRVRNRCQITGRPRGYYRRFGICRNMLRKLAMDGHVPGVVKSSW